MDYHDDLEGLPSDALESDYDSDLPAPVSDDYSSWPAESSPAPVDDDEEEHEEEEYDGEEEEFDDEVEDEPEEDEEEEEEYSDHEVEDDFEDHEEQSDHDIFDEHDDFEAEDGHEVEFLAHGDDGPGLHHWAGEVYWPSQEADDDYFAAEENSRAIDDILDDDSLFVDQRPANILPPIEHLISSVRRNHARALNLLHSEILRQDRELGREPAGPSRENHRENQRHHPYAMPRENSRERRRMADRRRNNNLFEDFRDELIEVEMQAPPRAPRRNRTPPRAQPEVIDLTVDSEPDEPVAIPPRARGPNASQIPGRRPRRSLSLSAANNATVIDLTLDDSPAPPPRPQQLPRRNNPDIDHHHHHHHHRHHHPRRASHRRPAPLEFVDRDAQEGFGARVTGLLNRLGLLHRAGFGRPPDVDVQFIGGRFNMDNLENPLGRNVPNLNYRGNGGGNNNGGAAPKPDHVPPPPAREGFTRDTGSADDVVICPGCEQELKYDPDAADGNAQRPAKRPRSRKDQEEHHFWALKDCGHVYCKNCYENRTARRTKNSPPSVFRRHQEDPRKLLCKVDDCMTEANNKQNWVGLFL